MLRIPSKLLSEKKRHLGCFEAETLDMVANIIFKSIREITCFSEINISITFFGFLEKILLAIRNYAGLLQRGDRSNYCYGS